MVSTFLVSDQNQKADPQDFKRNVEKISNTAVKTLQIGEGYMPA
jgi:hypothetical protein